MQTTLSDIRAHKPCEEGYKKLVKHLGGVKAFGADTSFPVETILESNGLDDTLWVLSRACGEKGKIICHGFACDAAERVLHLYEDKYPGDKRVRNAIDVKRKWIRGEASDEELCAAANTVYAAANAAAAVRTAASRAAEKKWQTNHLKSLLTTQE
jgi:hypothetical protein